MAFMFSLGSWKLVSRGGWGGTGGGTASQGGLAITVFPLHSYKNAAVKTVKEKPRLINLLIFTQPPHVNLL